MKFYLAIAGILLAALNALLLVPAARAYTTPIAVLALILALLVAAFAFVRSEKTETAPAPATPAPVPAPRPVVAPPPAPAANQAESEVVAFFALLQEKGRLVDFLMEDITSYDDAQVGAAARVVHQGCRQVLQEHFNISAISSAEEGSQVTVPAGYASAEYRLIGKLSGDPPFKGRLIHKGWKTETVKLPRIVNVDEKRLPPIAPAEVELG